MMKKALKELRTGKRWSRYFLMIIGMLLALFCLLLLIVSIIRRYKRCIDYLRHIKKTEELFLMPSLHYETLTGSKAGISSIRVNDQYRIEFAITTREEPVITICNILELSNHYKK